LPGGPSRGRVLGGFASPEQRAVREPPEPREVRGGTVTVRRPRAPRDAVT